MARKQIYLIGAIGWTLLIAILCLVKFNDLPSIGIGGADKYVHLIFYFGFMVAWYLNFSNASIGFKKIIFRIFIASVIYGILIEFAQEFFTESRQADIYDVMANTAGALLAVATICIIHPIRKRKHN